MSNEIDLTTANSTIIPLTHRGGISEKTIAMMAEAHGKMMEKMHQDLKEGKSELIVMNPKESLLPELEYIGDGKYRFKKDTPSS
jgi:hypothetical protein